MRDLIDAEFAKPFPERVNAFVIGRGLPRDLIVHVHGAEFQNAEAPVLHPGAGLHMEDRPGGLETLRQPDDRGQEREDDEHDRERDREDRSRV